MIRALVVQVTIQPHPESPKTDVVAVTAGYHDENADHVEHQAVPPLVVLKALEQARESLLQGSCLPAEARPMVSLVRPQ